MKNSKPLSELLERSNGETFLRDIQIEKAKRKLIDFTTFTYSEYIVGWVHKEIAAKLDQFLADVIAGKSPRLMIFVPPRHGKSELVSRRFPAFALGKHPDLSIIATSYGAELATQMNRDVQRIIDSDDYREVFPDTQLYGKNIRTVASGSYLRNSDIFEVVNHKGCYKCAGVGGGITGLGGSILICDDPIKDAEQANSEVYRKKLWEWYTSTLATRCQPGGGILIIQTRWHEDDLAGRLVAHQKQEGATQWEIINYPAIAEKDELHRKEGEALHPERYSLAALKAIMVDLGSRVWNALFQQRPSAMEGTIFKREWWQFYRETPTFKRIIQSWDTAFKKGEDNDFSVCTTWGEAVNGFYLIDRWSQKVEFPELSRAVKAQNEKHKPNVILIEDKASGQSIIQALKKESSLTILAIKVDTDKVSRANAVTPTIEAGKVFLPENASWQADYMDVMATFPNGAHDDDVDSTTQALKYLRFGGGATGMLDHMRELMEAKLAGKTN